MNTNWTSPVKQRTLRVFGAWGMFELNFIEQSVYFYENPSHVALERFLGLDMSISEGMQVKYNVPKDEPLRLQYKHFFETVESGKDFLKKSSKAP